MSAKIILENPESKRLDIYNNCMHMCNYFTIGLIGNMYYF